jgi:uracil-DNA glycosylase
MVLNNKIDLLLAIDHKLQKLAEKHTILPTKAQIFSALQATEPNHIRVVIIGQDPYHGANQANGMSFAVPDELRPLPPSLYNIYAEILLNNLDMETLAEPTQDLIMIFKNSDSAQKRKIMNGLHHRMINHWPQQGVLLLNTSLTVILSAANSLQNIGWHAITSDIIKQVSLQNPHCVFMLWGSYAKSLQQFIETQQKHLILTTVHPSPLSAHRGFFGRQHFKHGNDFLAKNDIAPIKWIAN